MLHITHLPDDQAASETHDSPTSELLGLHFQQRKFKTEHRELILQNVMAGALSAFECGHLEHLKTI